MFASNHQSHIDTPAILWALPRVALPPDRGDGEEFFKAHFFPNEFGRRARFTNSLNYYLAALFFNAFPLPQREAGAPDAPYIGDLLTDGWSVLIFPEAAARTTGRSGSGRVSG